MELTDYDLEMFQNLETLLVESGWYTIKKDRNDLDKFIAAIKKRIDHKNDFEFNGDYTKFRRIDPFVLPETDDITYKIEFRDQDTVEFDYSHLPDPKFTPENKIIKKRAI